MGLMKEHLAESITDFAKRVGATEREIYSNSFYYDLAVEYAERKLNRAVKKILEASAMERVEGLAKQFKNDTGLLAPFKDEPAACGNDPHYDQAYRKQEYDKWLRRLDKRQLI